MDIKYLDWDSHFFGHSIGRLDVNRDDEIEDISRCFNSVGRYGCIYLFMPDLKYAENALNLLECAGDVYERRVYENRDLTESEIPEEVNLLSKADSIDDLYALSLASGHRSRFVRDPKFAEHSPRYFRAWIDGSINGSTADFVYVTRSDSRVVGFVTISIRADAAQIGLIAVDAGSRGQGIGKKLLQAAEYCSLVNDRRVLRIPTQGDNRTAVRFYEKAGYQIAHQEFIIHYWLS